jgi:hypothetical protein
MPRSADKPGATPSARLGAVLRTPNLGLEFYRDDMRVLGYYVSLKVGARDVQAFEVQVGR